VNGSDDAIGDELPDKLAETPFYLKVDDRRSAGATAIANL
jgi:hypothetical protein